MQKSRVKQKWSENRLALGTLVKSTDPIHTEILSQMDFDFLWMDLEHADKSLETFSNLARASRTGQVDILARPARWEYMRMGRLLECGSHGILYPRCESALEAQEVVRWSKFHPIGERGFDGGGADNNYGSYPAGDYTKNANQNTWIAIQIESPLAVSNIDEIASVDEVDCLFFGPGDFSALSGLPGEVKHERTLEAARRVAKAAESVNKIFGTLVFDMEHAEYMISLGAKLLVHSADVIQYKAAFQKIAKDYQGLTY